MFSPRIARELRERGHDVVAVKERPELIGLADRDLVRRKATERRAIVTSDVDDFAEVAGRFARSGEDHYGMLFTSDTRLPRSKAAIPFVARVLEQVLREHPADDACRNRTRTLP